MLIHFFESSHLLNISDVSLYDLADQFIMILSFEVYLILHLFGDVLIVVVIWDDVQYANYCQISLLHLFPNGVHFDSQSS